MLLVNYFWHISHWFFSPSFYLLFHWFTLTIQYAICSVPHGWQSLCQQAWQHIFIFIRMEKCHLLHRNQCNRCIQSHCCRHDYYIMYLILILYIYIRMTIINKREGYYRRLGSTLPPQNCYCKACLTLWLEKVVPIVFVNIKWNSLLSTSVGLIVNGSIVVGNEVYACWRLCFSCND